MKETVAEDGTRTVSWTFADHYIYELKRIRGWIDEAIARLECIDRDVRPDANLVARAYVAFNAEMAAGAMHSALKELTEINVDFAGARALLSPKPDNDRHASAERLRPLVEEAQQLERGEAEDAPALRDQLLDVLWTQGGMRLPALMKTLGDAYLKSHPLRNPADGHWRDAAHQTRLKRVKQIALDLIEQGVLTVGDDYKVSKKGER